MARPTAPVPDPSRSAARPDLFLVLVVAVAFAIRLVWCLYAARTPTSFGDPFSYLTHADELARGKGYVTFFVGRPTAYYPVGYPALLAGILWLARLVVPATTAMQVAIGLNLVCGTATVAAVHTLALRLAGRRTARIAAVLVAAFPSLILYTATAYLETVFCFLVVLIALLVVPARADRDTLGAPASGRDDGERGRGALRIPSWPALAGLGVLLALATMVRPITLAFLPVLLIAWGVGRPGWRHSLGAVAILAAIVALAVVPWSIRSSRALHGVVLVSTNTGDNLCIGHSPESQGAYIDLNDLCGGGYEDVPEDEREATRNSRGTSRALTYAREHPLREVKLLALKTYHLVAHDHEGIDAVESYGADAFLPEGLRALLRVLADGFYYAVGALALVGAAWTAWKGPADRRLLLAWAVTLLAVPLVFFGGSRFHLPALPLAAVFAALAVDAFARSVADRRTSGATLPSPPGA